MNLDNDRLRDLLERTAPHRPVVDPGARAAAVARRGRAARIRDSGLVAGAAAAVLAAAIAVPLSLGGEDGPGNVAVAPPAPTAPPCPAERLDVGTPRRRSPRTWPRSRRTRCPRSARPSA